MISLRKLIAETNDPYTGNVEDGKRSVEISREKTVNLLDNDATTAWKKHMEEYRIFRGVGGNPHPYMFASPSKSYRYARNTTNTVNAILELIPSWKGWPKRSRSIVCSSSEKGAGWYGKIYQVFPFNGAKIGVCADHDFWDSFNIVKERFSGIDTDTLNSEIQYAFEAFGQSGQYKSITPDDVKKIFDAIDKQIHESEDGLQNALSRPGYGGKMMIKDMMGRYEGHILNYFDELLNPENNGFQLTTIEDYSIMENNRREVWTDADSLLIAPQAFHLLRKTPMGVNITNVDGTKEHWPLKSDK